MKRAIILFIILLPGFYFLRAQYITEVLEYCPAPGQYINTTSYGSPVCASATSPTSIVGRLTGAMSLGAFGGYVIFRFGNSVENHENNPYGIDFVLYGNPLQNVLNTEVDNRVTWSEPGIVSVMQDKNGNGLADDTWYELAGSDYFFSSTMKNYEVTYTNPGTESAVDVPWVDNQGNSGAVLANSYHTQPYYPLNDSFPDIDPESYTLTGTRIEDYVDKTTNSNVTCFGRPFGYADNTLRGTYDGLPDNPYTSDEEEGSGGDAFDIDWAVDENGDYIDLDEIDFVKVHCGVLADAGWLGEVSTEITGAFDVAPDNSVTGELNMIVIKDLPDTISSSTYQIEAFVYYKGRKQDDASITWSADIEEALVDENNLLTITTTTGELTLTATLSDNSEITESVSAVIDISEITAIEDASTNPVTLFPNPATSYIQINNADNALVSIYSATGNKITGKYNSKEKIDVSNLHPGLYIVRIKQENSYSSVRFIKQ